MSLRRSLIIWPMAEVILTGSLNCTASFHLLARMMTGMFLSLLFWTLPGDWAGWTVEVKTIFLIQSILFIKSFVCYLFQHNIIHWSMSDSPHIQITLRGSPGKGDNYHFLLNICYSLLKKALFKMAFHGGSGNVWSGLMQTAEVLLSMLLYLLPNYKTNISSGSTINTLPHSS